MIQDAVPLASSKTAVETLLTTVVQGGYCIGCGACTAVSDTPLQIALDELGRFQAVLGKSDGRKSNANVLAVCPFSERAPSEDSIGATLYGDQASYHSHIGYHRGAYAGFVVSGEFRAQGSSGGMAKWILYELLRQNLVDAVVQVRQNKSRASGDLLYEYYIATSTAEVKAGSKSAYYPVNMAGILQHIYTNPGRYAIVGVPCFIKAIRLLMIHNPVYQERIQYTVGLVCGHMKSTWYAEMLGWQQGIDPGYLDSIDFRKKIAGRQANEKGVEITGKRGGETVNIIDVVGNLFGTDYNYGFFKYKACNYCDDVVAETADISIGDAWLPEYLVDGKGTNVVVVRHPHLDDLIHRAVAVGDIVLESITPERVVESQGAGFRDRREGLSYRLFMDEKRSVWHPPKRVQPQQDHISKQRRSIYQYRIQITDYSYRWFQKAIKQGDFSIFEKEMKKVLFRYRLLYGSQPEWRQILIYRKLLFTERVRSALRATGLYSYAKNIRNAWLK